MTPVRISAIVLAGGRSSRFGGDKLSTELEGRTVLERTIAAVQSVVDEVLVVGRAGERAEGGERSERGEGGGRAAERVGYRRATLGVRYLPDDRVFEGPLAGLAVGLRAASGQVVLAIGGDMALARSSVLRLLLDRIGPIDDPTSGSSERPSAAAMEDSGTIRPLPLAVLADPAAREAELALASGQRSLGALLDRLQPAVLEESTWRLLDPDADTLLDIDTPDDLALARSRLVRGG